MRVLSSKLAPRARVMEVLSNVGSDLQLHSEGLRFASFIGQESHGFSLVRGRNLEMMSVWGQGKDTVIAG